jgi:hypothetical protein
MSAYLCDLSQNFLKSGLRKRFRALENARQMARLPHALTWIEFDYPAYLDRAKSEYGIKPIKSKPDSKPPARAGYLLQRHPEIETAFKATETSSAESIRPLKIHVCPTSIVWCTDATPIPWRQTHVEDLSGFCVNLPFYKSPQVALTYTYNDTLTNFIMDKLEKENDPSWAPALPIRDLWGLLAGINDMPVTIEHVAPAKGFIARGAYRKFLSHSVVRLTVPQTRWRRLAIKTATLLRRRAHQVRDHWRDNWRRPLSKLCDHEFDSGMVCAR